MFIKIRKRVEQQAAIRKKEIKGDWEDTESHLKVFELYGEITREQRKELLKVLKK
jgi:hypothetical protein